MKASYLSLILALMLLSLFPAKAQQQAPDPRLCAAQLNQSEADVANLVRTMHALGAQNQLLVQDNAALKKELDEFKAAPKKE